MERRQHRLQGSTANVNHQLESLPGHHISWYRVEVQQRAGARLQGAHAQRREGAAAN